MTRLKADTRDTFARRDLSSLVLLSPFALWLARPAGSEAFESKLNRAESAVGDYKNRLLALLPALNVFGAPATNVTVPAPQAAAIETAAAELERAGLQRGLAHAAGLSGSWRLLYTNAPELTSLAEGLPLGFALGKVYQPIDVDTARFENQAAIANRFSAIVHGTTRVVGDLRVAPLNSLNAAGVLNTEDNRIEVDFRRVVFSLESPFLLRKVVAPRVNPSLALPAVDVTYLDTKLRITRGGDGSLFILQRTGLQEDNDIPPPMLTALERSILFRDDEAEAVTTGNTKLGLGNWSRNL